MSQWMKRPLAGDRYFFAGVVIADRAFLRLLKPVRRQCPLWILRYRAELVASPAMSVYRRKRK